MLCNLWDNAIVGKFDGNKWRREDKRIKSDYWVNDELLINDDDDYG